MSEGAKCLACGAPLNGLTECPACGFRQESIATSISNEAPTVWCDDGRLEGQFAWLWAAALFMPAIWFASRWCVPGTEDDLSPVLFFGWILASAFAPDLLVRRVRRIIRKLRESNSARPFGFARQTPLPIEQLRPGVAHIRGKVTVLVPVPNAATPRVAASLRVVSPVQHVDAVKSRRTLSGKHIAGRPAETGPDADRIRRNRCAGTFLIDDGTGSILVRGPVFDLYAPIRGVAGEVRIEEGDTVDVQGTVASTQDAERSGHRFAMVGTSGNVLLLAPPNLEYPPDRTTLGVAGEFLSGPYDWYWRLLPACALFATILTRMKIF